MTAARAGVPGRVDLPGISPYPNDMEILTNASQLPADPRSLPDDTVISIGVWAALQGVRPSTVHRNRVLAEARRGTDKAKPGDMPAEDGKLGLSPYWQLGTYRKWEAARPGKGAGAGRPAGTGRGRSVKVKLPITCPHCQHEVTREDLGLDESGKPLPEAKPASRPAGRKRPVAATAGRP